MSDGQRALAWLRERYERRAGSVRPLPFGVAIVTDELPSVYDANFLVVDSWGGDAAALAAAADAAQLELGFAHRRSVILDQTLVERLGDGLGALGLGFCSRYLVMALRRPAERPTDPSIRVVELAAADYDRARAEAIRRYPWGSDEEVVRQLVAFSRRIGAVVPTTRLGVRVEETTAAYASLYVDDGVAEIDDVETHEAHRRRGYATAVVHRAIDDAHAAGADLVFLVTAADDWPQHLYRRLGFETVATELVFGRPAA